MPRLKHPGAIPYGGMYRLELVEKGFVGQGSNFDMLMANIRAYRKANGLPIGLGLQEEVEQEVCARYPAECVEGHPDAIPQRTVRIEDLIAGTKVMLSHWWNGRQTVSQEEANRRAAICAVCPNQGSVTLACGGLCGEIKTIVESVVGGRNTPSDGALRQCGICHCWNSAAVHVPLDIQWAVLHDRQKDLFRFAKQHYNCWKCAD